VQWHVSEANAPLCRERIFSEIVQISLKIAIFAENRRFRQNRPDFAENARVNVVSPRSRAAGVYGSSRAVHACCTRRERT